MTRPRLTLSALALTLALSGSVSGQWLGMMMAPDETPCYRAGGAPEPWGAWSAVAASESASWVDRTGHGNTLTEVGAGTGWSTAGWTPGGVGALSMGAALGASDTILTRVSGCPTTSVQIPIGAWQSNVSPLRFANVATSTGTGKHTWGWGNAYQEVAGAIAAGTVGIAGGQGYRDGSADGTATSGTMPTGVAWIGGRNNAENASNRHYSSCTVHWAVRWTSTLTAAQMAAVTTACAGW